MPQTSNLRRLQITFAALLLCVVSWGLLSPHAFTFLRTGPLSPLRTLNDVLLHCGAYTTAGLICCLLFSGHGDTFRTRVICGLLMFHGVATELLQALIPTRTCDPVDGFANITGVAFGAVIALRLQRPAVTMSVNRV